MADRLRKRNEVLHKRRMILAAAAAVVLVAIPIIVTVIVTGNKGKTASVSENAGYTGEAGEDNVLTEETEATDEYVSEDAAAESASEEEAAESASEEQAAESVSDDAAAGAVSEDTVAEPVNGEVPDNIKVLSNRINIYADPDKSSNYETMYYVKGYVFKVNDESNGWYNIEYVDENDDDKTGWVRKEDVVSAE